MNEQKLYMRPKEVEQVFSIKQSTLSKQRDGKFGLPFTVVGRNPKKNRGGISYIKFQIFTDTWKGKVNRLCIKPLIDKE